MPDQFGRAPRRHVEPGSAWAHSIWELLPLCPKLGIQSSPVPNATHPQTLVARGNDSAVDIHDANGLHKGRLVQVFVQLRSH